MSQTVSMSPALLQPAEQQCLQNDLHQLDEYPLDQAQASEPIRNEIAMTNLLSNRPFHFIKE